MDIGKELPAIWIEDVPTPAEHPAPKEQPVPDREHEEEKVGV